MDRDIKSLYIRILEFAKDKSDGFTEDDLTGDLKLIEDCWEKKIIKKMLSDSIKSGNMDISNGQVSYSPIFETPFYFIGHDLINNTPKYILTYGAYFNYIDYLELIESKKTSKNANKNSYIALCAVIITTVITTIISFYLTNKQIKIPVELKNEQFNKMIQPTVELNEEQLKVIISNLLEIKNKNFNQ